MMALAAAYEEPALLATGTEDELITDGALDRYRKHYADRLEERRYEGVGRTFESMAMWERLLEATADFLALS